MRVQNEALTKLGKAIAKKYWGLELNIDLYWTDELKDSTYGCYFSKYKRDSYGKVIGRIPVSIDISTKHGFQKRENKEQLLSVVKHEVCHWACQTMGKPFKDGSKFFESELYRIGAFSTHNNIFTEKGMASSMANQVAIIEGKKTRLGDTDFRYVQTDGKDSYEHMYEVYYKEVLIGHLGKFRYGKYKWNPISIYKDWGNLCWTTRKHAANNLLKEYERFNGKFE